MTKKPDPLARYHAAVMRSLAEVEKLWAKQSKAQKPVKKVRRKAA